MRSVNSVVGLGPICPCMFCLKVILLKAGDVRR